MKYDIFVSYQRANREFVAQVVRRLEAAGVGAWYDANIDGGADWRETIVAALEASEMLVIFFSEECNNSRQLKKELAVADSLGKPVVPILLEDTRPRGAYLYELADRNWIQAWPDPVSKLDELVGHLTTLAGKAHGAPAETTAHGKLADILPPPDVGGSAGIAKAVGEPAAFGGPPPAPSNVPPSAQSAAAPGAADKPVAEIALSAPTGRPADAYVGKISQQKKAGPSRDILPFKWIDLPILAVLVGGFYWLLKSGGAFKDPRALVEQYSLGLLCLALIGFYGALVFPVRYYLRRRPVETALLKYLISSLILYAVLIAAFTTGWMSGLFPNDRPSEVAVAFGIVWGVFTVIAFVVYGVLSAQRALRSFRANIKKL